MQSVENTQCIGPGNSAIDLSVNVGFTPYTYSWSNGGTTEDINGLANGTFTCILTDSIGCSYFDTVEVGFGHLDTSTIHCGFTIGIPE